MGKDLGCTKIVRNFEKTFQKDVSEAYAGAALSHSQLSGVLLLFRKKTLS